MPDEDLEKKLNEEREKVRLNSIKMLKLLGYEHDATKFTQEQLDARIELRVGINNKKFETHVKRCEETWGKEKGKPHFKNSKKRSKNE